MGLLSAAIVMNGRAGAATVGVCGHAAEWGGLGVGMRMGVAVTLAREVDGAGT